MKIAIVCFNISWQSGGPRLIFSSAQALKKLGHRVVIYAPEFSGEYFKELRQGLSIRIVKPKHEFVWAGRPKNILTWMMRKIVQERLKLDTAKRIAAALDDDFDIVNVHDFAYPVGFFYKKRNPRAKILWTENDPPFMYLPKKNFYADVLSRVYNASKNIVHRRYFKAIDKVAVLDMYNKLWCEARGLTPTVIRLGVDFEHFYLPVKDFRKKAKQKSVRLFGLGSLNEYRRYEDTILAVKLLRDSGYDARALIISNDMWDEKEYRNKLLTIVSEHKLGEYITFNFSGVSEDGLRNAYEESDVFVYAMYLPPPRNGFGFSIGVFEAMAAGLPLIICRTTTSTEVLEDGNTALFFNPMSPDEIAEKIKLLIDYPEQYSKIASAGQKFVKEQLSWGKYSEKVLEMFR